MDASRYTCVWMKAINGITILKHHRVPLSRHRRGHTCEVFEARTTVESRKRSMSYGASQVPTFK